MSVRVNQLDEGCRKVSVKNQNKTTSVKIGNENRKITKRKSLTQFWPIFPFWTP